MQNKQRKFWLIAGAVLIVGGFFILRTSHKLVSPEATKSIQPTIGSIQTVVSTAGSVLPKNRLEIKPAVNGRVEEILVQEGGKVKTGQVLARMSSTERAALLDAARGQGKEALQYWQEAYKPISLFSPIDGEVIVAVTQPGQTVTASEPVLVLSDKLIVRAQLDETDIGKIKLGQSAFITLDAYPDTKIKAAVEHIYYESELVNNVTIYNVDLVPEEVPKFFRSGMNAAVDFITENKERILLVPLEAVHKDQRGEYVFVVTPDRSEPVKTTVKTGAADDKNIEIVSGITKDDRIILGTMKYVLPKKSDKTNPFLPGRH